MEITGSVLRATIGDRYNRSGHPFHYCPVAALDRAMGSYDYFATNFADWCGPATGDADSGGWRLGSTGTSIVGLEQGITGCRLKIETGATDDNSAFLWRIDGGWRYVIGKRLWCFAKFEIEDVDKGEVVFGLASNVAAASCDSLAEFLALDDGIYYEKAAAATEFDFHIRKSDANTEQLLVSSTFADTTARILGFVVDASGNIKGYDGTTIDNLTENVSVTVGVSNIPDDVTLSPYIGIETAENVAHDVTVDWVFVAQEI